MTFCRHHIESDHYEYLCFTMKREGETGKLCLLCASLYLAPSQSDAVFVHFTSFFALRTSHKLWYIQPVLHLCLVFVSSLPRDLPSIRLFCFWTWLLTGGPPGNGRLFQFLVLKKLDPQLHLLKRESVRRLRDMVMALAKNSCPRRRRPVSG